MWTWHDAVLLASRHACRAINKMDFEVIHWSSKNDFNLQCMLSQFSKNKNSTSAYWICWRPRNHRNLTKKSVGACHPAISLDRHLLKLHLGLEGWHWLSQWTAPSPEETRGQLAGPWWTNWHKWPKWQNQQMCSWAKKPAVKELIQSTILFGFFTGKNTSPRLLTLRIKVKASWVLGLMMNLAACIGIERPSRHKLQASIPLATTQINLVQVNWVNSHWHMTSRPQHLTKHWKIPSRCNPQAIIPHKSINWVNSQ